MRRNRDTDVFYTRVDGKLINGFRYVVWHATQAFYSHEPNTFCLIRAVIYDRRSIEQMVESGKWTVVPAQNSTPQLQLR